MPWNRFLILTASVLFLSVGLHASEIDQIADKLGRNDMSGENKLILESAVRFSNCASQYGAQYAIEKEQGYTENSYWSLLIGMAMGRQAFLNLKKVGYGEKEFALLRQYVREFYQSTQPEPTGSEIADAAAWDSWRKSIFDRDNCKELGIGVKELIEQNADVRKSLEQEARMSSLL